MKRITKFLLSWFVLLLVGSTAFAEELQVDFLNVGQGDSALVTCGGQSLLIDAGGNDDVEPVVNFIRNKRGLSRLDYVVGTHPHEDHIGALDAVIETFDVGEILLPGAMTTTDTFMDVLTAIETKNMGITVPEPGQTYELGGAQFEILAPVKDYGDDLNNWSIVLRVTYGGTSYLFTGDIEAQAEADLLNSGADLEADVLKTAHHGADTSSTEAFLRAVSPQYALISCGTGNSYGHPHRGALDRLQSVGAKLFRTDCQGTVSSVSDGNSVSWNAEPADVWTAGNDSSWDVPDGGASGTDSAWTSDTSGTDASWSTEDVSEDTGSTVIVHITNTGEKYHTSGCRYLKKSDIPVSLSDAKARGLTACSVCNPPQ